MFASRQGCNDIHISEKCTADVCGGSVLAITWTRAVTSCRVNCCRRPVFKNLVLRSILTAVVLRPPQTHHLQILFLQHRHRRLADADSPMFQQALMSPIFDVRCIHRPNSTGQLADTQTRALPTCGLDISQIGQLAD